MLVEFTQPSLESQSEAGSGVEIRQEFVTEDIYMFSPGNAAISHLRCPVWYLDSHHLRKCFFPRDTKVMSD